MKKYEAGNTLGFLESLACVIGGETIIWNGKAKNAAFMMNVQVGTFWRASQAKAFQAACLIKVEEKKKE